ncbi:MAG: hypothetical protein AUJ20_00320 [Comamonadaceae bacterium CG1_02_60_18]|nr:MAG: hypothetical protein AUJ20_00320 [Comamonadaceae bacterium CG1_02_60_18]PIQ56472.1 MAG: hypothetical protein COW02_01220 [Comamonadaceae bacterium CG12_big_fil_rev_8_21_14_0_65_59_15]
MDTIDSEICTTNTRLQAQAGEVWLLDVREPSQVATLALDVPAVVNTPLNQLPQRWRELPLDKPWVLVCLDGRQSVQAQAFLVTQGVRNARVMHGGILMWMQKGYPVKGQRFT